MERKARLAGSWYPARQDELLAITGAGRGEGGLALGILPHAGLFYSGAFIRGFFDSLARNCRRIVIISPSHYYALDEGLIVTAAFDSAATPLGPVRVEPLEVDGAVCSSECIAIEHGIEMFLPFAKARGDLPVSFAVLGHASSLETLYIMRDRIEACLTEGDVLIASSDFTHYGPRFSYTPYGTEGAVGKVRVHDDAIASMLASGKVEELFAVHRKTTICGIVPAMICSLIARGRGLEGAVLASGDSDTIANSTDGNFVSYAAVGWKEVGSGQGL